MADDNSVYFYRHINHVKTLEPGETHEDHIAEVHAKYERLKNPKGKETPSAAQPAAPLIEANDTTPKYRVSKADGIGWWDVVGLDGKPINEKSMRKADAEAMAAENNAREMAA